MRRLSNLGDNIKLDIGCGEFKIDGFVSMDWQDFGQEIVWDINHGIPLPNDSVSELHTSHFIEHIEVKDIINLILEIVRVCKNGAKVTLIAPHADTLEAYYICHYSLWNEQRIEGICKEIKQMELIKTYKEGINFIANIIIKK